MLITHKATHTSYEFPELSDAEETPKHVGTTKFNVYPKYIEAIYNYTLDEDSTKAKIAVLKSHISTISIEKTNLLWEIVILVGDTDIIHNGFEDYNDAATLRKDLLEWLISS